MFDDGVADHAAPSNRASRRSIFARPYICRLTSLSFVICPSTWPFDQGCVIAAHTAAMSLRTIVDADDGQRMGSSGCPPSYNPKQRIVADRQHQPPGEARCCSAAECQP